LLPIFWKTLNQVEAVEILAHRVAWALVIALVLVAYRGDWSWLRRVFQSRRVLLTFTATSLLISINWLVYILAVNTGHIVETSLGYFMNPLVNVLLGVVFLKERLRIGQGVAISIALCGVLYLAIYYGSLPWIAVALASSFGCYGLLRKTASIDSLQGFTLETLLLFPLAIGFLIYQETVGRASFGHAGVGISALLAAAGLVTAVPMLLFAAGARRITLTTLGILQYIAPTIQLLLGVLVYGEPLTTERLIGFCLIWLALGVYTAEGLMLPRRVKEAKVTRSV
jgi:chloramphenicol-sensitive protein RarD